MHSTCLQFNAYVCISLGGLTVLHVMLCSTCQSPASYSPCAGAGSRIGSRSTETGYSDSGVGSGTTGTGISSGTAGTGYTTGTGIGGAHNVITNDNLSSTPILHGQGVTHVNPGENTSFTGAGTGAGHGSGLSGSGTGSAGKGAEYDASGGQVDDRSMMQKGMDAVKPGSQVGSHTN